MDAITALNDVERAIYDLVRRNRLAAITRDEVFAALKGVFARGEIQQAFTALCRKGIIYRRVEGWYQTDW